MTIGEALAQARRQAGLSIAQVSQKTRIREAIIRDIERDDYSACGGDFYARGHIRAIARAAGADSEPLIQQYDAVRSGAGQFAAAEDFTASDEFGPDGYARPAEFGPDGFAAPDGYAAPEEFGPGGYAPRKEFGPGGYAPREELAPGGYAPREELGPGGYAAPKDFETGGFAAPDEFGPGGFVAPDEFGPGGFAAQDYLGSGEFAVSDEDASPVSGEFAVSDEDASPVSGEFVAQEEITAPNPAVTTSQIAALEGIMASRSATEREVPEPEVPAPGVTAPGVTAPGVRAPGGWAPRDPAPGGWAPRDPAPGGRTPGGPPPGGWAPGGPAPQHGRRAGPTGEGRRGRPDRIAIVAAVLALAIFGGLAYLLIPGSRSAPQAGPAAATGPSTHGQATPGSGHPATNSPTATPRTAPPVTLTPARAVAFGPGGPAHGDNPQNASLAIDGRPRTAWQTDWYTTSHFGNLKAGTGLLLDMGHPVTITSARVTLGGMPGADLQLRVGGTATLAGLRPVARAADARGMVRLQLARPAQGRYVLIWFTQLPPDPAGTYQAKVYNVRLR